MTPVAWPSGDPYLAPSTSLGNRLARLLWAVVYWCFFRPSPRPLHAWRAGLLRCFGARLGPHCHIYPGAQIWAPWRLVCEDAVGVADGAIIYNPAGIHLASHCVISQQAYLCGATHDFDDPAFSMISKPIRIGAYAWVCARAAVSPGVSLGEGAVLGMNSVATRSLDPWTVYGGIPARAIRMRKRHGRSVDQP